MRDYDTLLADASQPPLDERIRPIETFWDTMPDDAMPPLSDEWLAEVQRRSAEYDVGSVQPTPWEQIRAVAPRRSCMTDEILPTQRRDYDDRIR